MSLRHIKSLLARMLAVRAHRGKHRKLFNRLRSPTMYGSAIAYAQWTDDNLGAGHVLVDALQEYPVYADDPRSRAHLLKLLEIVEKGLTRLDSSSGNVTAHIFPQGPGINEYQDFLRALRDLSRVVYQLPEKSEERGSIIWRRSIQRRLQRMSRTGLKDLIMRNDRNADVHSATKGDMIQILMEWVEETNETPEEWFQGSSRDPQRSPTRSRRRRQLLRVR